MKQFNQKLLKGENVTNEKFSFLLYALKQIHEDQNVEQDYEQRFTSIVRKSHSSVTDDEGTVIFDMFLKIYSDSNVRSMEEHAANLKSKL